MNFTEKNTAEYWMNFEPIPVENITVLSFNTTHDFVYSKMVDSLPITGTHVGNLPCEDPLQY